MELRQLRYFVAVFAERSISRAADHLTLSQPALTRQIRALEREMGVQLFDRVATGVRPTTAAAALHAHAVQVLRLVEQSHEVARSATAAKERVEIGLPPGMPQDRLWEALERIRAIVPHAAVTFVDVESVEQLRLLSEGRLDIGLVHQRPPDTLRHVLLLAQPFGIAVRPGQRLGDGEHPHCELRHLDDVRVLAHGRDQVPFEHDRMVLAAQEAGVTPRWHFVRFSENALLCAEAAGADAVLLSESSARRLLPDWPWRPLVEPQVDLCTWIAHPALTRGDRKSVV